MKRYPLLDPFRLALALCVAVGHLFGWLIFPAVPGFLALSGFLVLMSFENDPRWQVFAWKRILRVYPALIALFVAAFFLVGWRATANMGIYYLRFGFAPRGINDPLWSLPFEEVLYAVLAILFLTGNYKRRWPIWMGVGIGFLLWVYGIFATGETLPRTLALPWCFFVGNLAYIYRDRLRPVRFAGFPLVALALVVEIYGVVTKQTPVTLNLSALPAAPGIVLLGTQFVPRLPRIPDFSYSCYIWHFFLRSWCIAIGISRLFVWPLLIVTCVASFYFIEKPALEFKNFWLRSRKSESLHEPAIVPVDEPELATAT